MLLLAALLGTFSPTASAKEISLKFNSVEVQCTACPACGAIDIPGMQQTSSNKIVKNRAYFSPSGEFNAVDWVSPKQTLANNPRIDRSKGSFALIVTGTLGQNDYQYDLEKLSQNKNKMLSTNPVEEDEKYCQTQTVESSNCKFEDNNVTISKGTIGNTPKDIQIGEKTYSCKTVPRTDNVNNQGTVKGNNGNGFR